MQAMELDLIQKEPFHIQVVELEDTMRYAEKMYSINVTANSKKFCLILHYNGDNSYLFVNEQKLLNLRQKINCSKSTLFRKHFRRLFCC